MKVGVELGKSFRGINSLLTRTTQNSMLLLCKRGLTRWFCPVWQTYKWSGVGFCFKIDKMFEFSCHTNNQFLEIMLMYFVFGLLYAQCLVGVNFVNFEKSVQNKENFNLLFTNIRFHLHLFCQRPFGFSYWYFACSAAVLTKRGGLLFALLRLKLVYWIVINSSIAPF